jgi:hypothetical protein
MTQQNPSAPTSAQDQTARVAQLHRLCRDDYDSNAARRAQDHRDDAFLISSAAEAVAAR